MKTDIKTNFKAWPAAMAVLAIVSFIATWAVTATATTAYERTNPALQMETITVTAKRIRTERMAAIIVSAPRLANSLVANAPIAGASDAARL